MPVSAIRRSLSTSIRIGIDTVKAREVPRTDFGSVLSKGAQSRIPRYTAGDLGTLAYANVLIESGYSKAQVKEFMAELPAGDPESDSPEAWEIDRLLAIIAQLQGMVVGLNVRLNDCQENTVANLAEIEAQMDSLQEDAQRINMELINALHNQSRHASSVTSISRAAHDTMRAVLNNLRA